MSFAINPSMNHIDIPESCVYELYRSSAEVLLPDARFHGHASEAYICITKTEKTLKAYVALLETEMKTVFVYISDLSVSDPAEYPEVYAEAEAFLKTMGFTMEPVNLNFSPAMREVIIKGFRVMRPPPPKKPALRQQKPAAPVPDHQKLRMATPMPSFAPVAPETPGDLPTELESLQRELASAKAAIAQITREKVSLEQSASQEIASLKASCQQAIEAKQKATELLAAESEKMRQTPGSGATSLDAEGKASLAAELKAVTDAAKAEKDRLLTEKESLQQKIVQLEKEKMALGQKLAEAGSANADKNRMQDELSALLQKVDQLENDNLVLEQQLTDTAGELTQLAEEKEGLRSRIAAEESAAIAVADKLATLEGLETSWKESQQREEDLCRNLDLLHGQLDTMSKALDEYKDRERNEEELALRISGLEQELETARAELELAGSRAAIAEGVSDEVKQLQEQKTAIETEYVRFANETRDKELEMLDELAAAEAEIERLASEMEIQTQVAALEHAALRAELRRMISSGASAAPVATETEIVLPASPAVSRIAAGRERRLPASAAVVPPVVQAVEPEIALQSPAPKTAPPPVAPPPAAPNVQPVAIEPEPVDEPDDDEPDRPIVADKEIASRLINEFGGFNGSSSGETTEFSIDPDLTAIAYKEPEEIEALIYSTNSVQAVPDSSSIQRCKGYVVATNRDGSYKVYIAWYLTESKRVVICTPEHQPADSEDCIRILQDAVAYFEIVGFMMEIVELGDSLKSYKKALKTVPIFSRTKN